MSFYLAWIYRKGQRTKFFFRFSTLLSNIFAPYIQNLEICFAILVYFDFGYVWSQCITVYVKKYLVQFWFRRQCPAAKYLNFFYVTSSTCGQSTLLLVNNSVPWLLNTSRSEKAKVYNNERFCLVCWLIQFMKYF